MIQRGPATLALLVIPTVGLFAAACRGDAGARERPGAGRESAPIPAVEVVQAREGALPLYERLTGTVRASGEVAIYPQTTGSIARVFAQNGDAVRKGDPLVEIRAPGSRPQVAQARSSLDVARAELKEAEANLKELETQFRRTQVLGDEGLVPVDTVATQRAQVEASRAALARTRAQVAVAEATVDERAEMQRETIVRAPISGRVGRRNAEVGMRVGSDNPVFVIGRLDSVRVEVPVTQEVLTRIRAGQRAEVIVDRAGPGIDARVSRISPFLEAGSYSAEVEIDVPNREGRLVPGMFVTVDLFYGASARATLVPASAIYEHPTTGERGTFVTSVEPPARVAPPAPEGEAAGAARGEPIAIPFRPVTVVAQGPQTVGIRGVQPGEWVVVVGQHLLSEQGGRATPQARVRVMAWERILELQRLQRQDLLRQFMERQQRLASRQGTADAGTRDGTARPGA